MTIGVEEVDGLAEGKCLDLSQSLVIDGIDLSVVGSNDVSRIKDSDAIIFCTGSLYFAGEILNLN